MLLKKPAFALVAMLTLGLGIGANTAIFSVVHAVLIRPLPYRDADWLVRAIQNNPDAELGAERRGGGISTETFQQWRAGTQTLSHIGVFERSTMTLASRTTPARLVGALVSPALFPMLAVTPELGRGFSDAEEKPGNNAVILSHRAFNQGDRAGQPFVVLVNQAFAKRYGAESAVGKTIRGAIEGAGPAQIIGVVEDVKPVGLDKVIHPEVFVDYRQSASEPGIAGKFFFTVRTASDPAAVIAYSRVLLRRLDSQLTIDNIATLSQRLADSVGQPRFYAVLLGISATVAVTLAAVGIYGVMMFAVSQRTREIGIRMALGARRGDVLGLVLRQGAVLAAVGIAVGLAGAFALTRYLQTMVFGITTFDLPVFLVLSLLLASITALACYVPARRATRIDPIVALRYE